MALLKIGEFATVAKVTRQAVYRAIRTGRLRRRKDGRFDTTHDLNREFVATHNRKVAIEAPKQRRKVKVPRTREKKKRGRKPRKAKRMADVPYQSPFTNKDEPPGGSGEDLEDISARGQAELRKLLAQTRKYEIAADKDREILIDRQLVRRLLGTLSAVDVNELLTMGANVAPELAGLCGVEDNKIIMKVQKRIDELAYQLLQHRQRVIKDFLQKVRMEVTADETDE